MFIHSVSAFAIVVLSSVPASADRWTATPNFESRMIEGVGGSLFVRTMGKGPPVLLLHGYVETGDMWEPLAQTLAERFTVIVPDLPGLGQSTIAKSGYDKKTQAQSLHRAVESLGFRQISIVGHDLGGIVGYAYAALFRSDVQSLVFMEAPIPGVGPWREVATMPALWHWHFGGPDMERLVEGRERIYFDHFWRFAAHPEKIDPATRDHYAAQYSKPGGMRAGFAQFAAFDQDARDNQELSRQPLTIPVLSIGGERAFGHLPAAFMRAVAHDVREVVLADTGHWLLEENPKQVIEIVADFLAEHPVFLKKGAVE